METLNSTHFEHYQELNAEELVKQIGWSTVLGVSGGRVQVSPAAVQFPVSNGYSVMVQLHWNDTYTVTRILKRGAKAFIKGRVEGLYCEQMSEAVWKASCFRNVEWPVGVAE